MDHWEFLLQQQGTRNWLRIKSEKLAIAPGIYRIAAQSCPPDIEVNLQIIHQTFDQGGQGKRRSQQRTCNTNPKGLMVVIPFTELTPGLWELQITTQEREMMQTLRLQVEPPPEPPRPKTPPIASPETFAAAFAPQPQQPAPPPEFDSETAHGLLEQSISSLEHILAQVSEPPPYVDPPPVAQPVAAAPTETLFADAPDLLASSPPPDLHQVQLTIALLEDSFVRRRDEPILISGHVNALNPHQTNPLDQGFDGVLRYELRDPQSFDLLLNVEQPLSDATIPLVFNYLLDVPTAYATRLILGEVILEVFTQQQEQMLPYKLASQSFSITASLEELLDTVTQVPISEPEPIPDLQLPPTQLVDFGDLWAPPVEVRTEQTSSLPPRLNRSPSQRRKPLDLPSFGNPPSQQPPLERSLWDDQPEEPIAAPALTSSPEPEPPPSILALLSEDEGPPPPLTTTEEDWLGLTFWPEPSEPIPPITPPTLSIPEPPSGSAMIADVEASLDARSGEEALGRDVAETGEGNWDEEEAPTLLIESEFLEENGDWGVEPALDPSLDQVDAAFAQLPIQDRFWQQINDFAGQDLDLDVENGNDPVGAKNLSPSPENFPPLGSWVELGESLEAEFIATPPGEPPPEPDFYPDEEPPAAPALRWDAVEQALTAIGDRPASPQENRAASPQENRPPITSDANAWGRGDWPIQEFVVDDDEDEPPPPPHKGISQFTKGYDTSGLPYPKELWPMAQIQERAPLYTPKHQEPKYQEPTPVAAPILGVQGGELTAGEMILVKIKLPPQAGTFYVKLWVLDRETRQLLDGPRSFIEFIPNAAGELETMTQLIVPLGTQSVRFEAVTINVTTQQESHKTQCDRTVIPPNLQAFNDPDLF
ncbi:hypothetical protein VB712_02485 [Spirulina sp. CCNP1310]|nr:hypothetical protein [Spirulina sp. CCNP1310]